MELETAVEAAASAPEATIFTTATSPFLITHANAAWTRLCGWEASEVVGLTCGVLQGDETDRQALATLHEALDAQEAAEVRLINYTKSGRRFEQTLAIEPVTESGRVTHFRGILRPVDGGAPSAAGGAEDPMWAESKLLGERLAAHPDGTSNARGIRVDTAWGVNLARALVNEFRAREAADEATE